MIRQITYICIAAAFALAACTENKEERAAKTMVIAAKNRSLTEISNVHSVFKGDSVSVIGFSAVDDCGDKGDYEYYYGKYYDRQKGRIDEKEYLAKNTPNRAVTEEQIKEGLLLPEVVVRSLLAMVGKSINR